MATRSDEPAAIPTFTTLTTYTLQVIGPRNADGTQPQFEFDRAFLRETEENLTDLLPDGYSVVIKEWDRG